MIQMLEPAMAAVNSTTHRITVPHLEEVVSARAGVVSCAAAEREVSRQVIQPVQPASSKRKQFAWNRKERVLL